MSYDVNRLTACDYGYCDRYLGLVQPRTGLAGMGAYKIPRKSWLERLNETLRVTGGGLRAEGIDGESRSAGSLVARSLAGLRAQR